MSSLLQRAHSGIVSLKNAPDERSPCRGAPRWGFDVVGARARRRRRRRDAPFSMTNASSTSTSSSSSSLPGDPPNQTLRLSPREVEVRVCTNKTCRRQGSEAIAKLSSDLSLPGVTTKRCGCLGVCGAGPNVAFLIVGGGEGDGGDGGGGFDGRGGKKEEAKAKKKRAKQEGGIVASHVSTPARFLSALETATGISVSADLLRATTLRLRGNELARAGDLKGAEKIYTLALDGGENSESESESDGTLSPPSPPAPEGARHLLLSNRSGVRLALGDAAGALADAGAAVAETPGGRRWATALVRLSEARAALGDAAGAEEALEMARAADPAVDEALRGRKGR